MLEGIPDWLIEVAKDDHSSKPKLLVQKKVNKNKTDVPWHVST